MLGKGWVELGKRTVELEEKGSMSAKRTAEWRGMAEWLGREEA